MFQVENAVNFQIKKDRLEGKKCEGNTLEFSPEYSDQEITIIKTNILDNSYCCYLQQKSPLSAKYILAVEPIIHWAIREKERHLMILKCPKRHKS